MATAAALIAVAGCSATPGPAPLEEVAGPEPGCGPVRFAEVQGTTPGWLPERLDRFANDSAMCAGQWLTSGGEKFVAQGVAVRGHRAWALGYDARSYKPCRIVVVDLRTGQTIKQRGGGGMLVAGGPRHACRHGGGAGLTAEGLWVTQSDGLWLIDPETLAVKRGWWIDRPARGSWLVIDAAGGRLGVGNFTWRPGRRGTVHWFGIDDVLRSGVTRIGPATAIGSQRVPPKVQGALWGSLDGRKPGLWTVSSVTRCGVLTSPRGRSYAFLPGGEGLALTDNGRRFWVASESSSHTYHTAGGRPTVPHLAQFTAAVSDWAPATCTP